MKIPDGVVDQTLSLIATFVELHDPEPYSFKDRLNPSKVVEGVSFKCEVLVPKVGTVALKLSESDYIALRAQIPVLGMKVRVDVTPRVYKQQLEFRVSRVELVG